MAGVSLPRYRQGLGIPLPPYPTPTGSFVLQKLIMLRSTPLPTGGSGNAFLTVLRFASKFVARNICSSRNLSNKMLSPKSALTLSSFTVARRHLNKKVRPNNLNPERGLVFRDCHGKHRGIGNMRILVIDDEEMIRTLAVKILEKAGHAVMTAESGREGIELVERNPEMIDIAIVDNTMAGMTGLETIREIRRVSELLPCILSSGNVIELEHIPEDIRHHTYLLQKPYRPQTLVEKVADVRLAF